jgi:hypothetical protein
VDGELQLDVPANVRMLLQQRREVAPLAELRQDVHLVVLLRRTSAQAPPPVQEHVQVQVQLVRGTGREHASSYCSSTQEGDDVLVLELAHENDLLTPLDCLVLVPEHQLLHGYLR